MLCVFPYRTNSREKISFPITAEERIWLREFFQDFLFDSPGAYTLFGSKPVSSACFSHFTEEERKEYAAYIASMSPEERAKRTRAKRYDFEENYAKWMSIKDRFKIRQYLFGEFPSRIDELTTVVLFVNIETTLKTIIANYEDFRRVIGKDFDPIEAVFEVEQRNSPFWNTVMKSDALTGILHGFGKDSSYFFDWNILYRESNNKTGDFFRSLQSEFSDESDIRYQTPNHFMLPIFRRYGFHLTDQALIEKYQNEHSRIKALYKGKDEVDLALSWLTR